MKKQSITAIRWFISVKNRSRYSERQYRYSSADGVTQLDDGAVTLNDGMKEFKEEGIDKLAEVFDGDIEGLISRLER